MAEVPAFAKAFVGAWRIVEMDAWTADRLGLQNADRVLQQPALMFAVKCERERYRSGRVAGVKHVVPAAGGGAEDDGEQALMRGLDTA